MSLNMRNVTFAFAAVAILLAASGAIYFTASGIADREGLCYHGNGGTYNGSDTVYTNDHIVWGAFFKKDGYDLISWNSEADGSGKTYYIGQYIEYDGNLDLYAQWLDDALYNLISVPSYSNYTDVSFTLNLQVGDKTHEMKENLYVIAESTIDEAVITLNSEFSDWYYNVEDDTTFTVMRESGDQTYEIRITTEGAADIWLDGGDMIIDISDDVSIRMFAYQYQSDVDIDYVY